MPPRRTKRKARVVQEEERVPTPDLQIKLLRNVDFSTLCSVDHIRLRAGAFAHAVALHPQLATAAFGTHQRIGEYDLASGCCLATANLASPPTNLAYSTDGKLLIALLEDRSLVAFIGQLSASKTLLTAPSRLEKKHLLYHLAVGPGSRPAIFVAQHRASGVRIAYIPEGKEKLKQGLQLKADRGAPIVGLASHPSRAVLLVAFADGTMSGCHVSQKSLQSMWNVPLEEAPEEGQKAPVMRRAFITAEPHPLLNGAALIVVGTSAGYVTAWELTDTKSTPASAGRFMIQDGHFIIGAGVLVASACVLVFAKDVRGTIKTYAHRLVNQQSGTTLVPLIVQPENLQDAFGAEFKALRGEADVPEEGKEGNDGKDGKAEPQELEKNTEHGFWTATPIWSSESASSVRRGVDIGQVVLHQSTGVAALQWVPTGLSSINDGVPIDALSAADALAAKQLMRSTLLSISETIHASLAGTPPHMALHTSLAFWALLPGGLSQKLVFPRHAYLVDGGHLAAYSLRTGAVAPYALVPVRSDSGALRSPHHLLHSPARGTWLLFCRVAASDGYGDGWEFARFTQRGVELPGDAAPSFLPGVSGAFVGPNDEYFAVLALDRATIQLYQTDADELPKKPPGSSPAKGGGVLALFPGPKLRAPPPSPEEAMRALEAMEEGAPPPDSKGEEGRWLCWESVASELSMGHLPAPAGKKGRNAPLQPMYTLALLPGEHILQVAWQALREDIDMGDTPQAGNHPASVGAVLTSQRLLLLSPQLRVLVAAPPGPAITSFLWLGPALLYATSDHQVWLLRWDGQAALVASFGAGPRAALLGALPDRLLMVRAAPGGRIAMATRATSLLAPLLQSWATLPGSGLLPDGQWRSRMEIRRVLETFDSSGIDTATLGTLVAAGYADLAVQLTLPSRALHLTAADTAACAAAAGQWSTALVTLMAEYKRSIYFPDPPPKGSALYQRLIILGRGAMAYGKFSVARDCFEAAGQWEEVLPLCAFQGDFSALRNFTSKAAPGSQAARDAPLVDKLRWLLEARFARASAIGARTLTADWSVSMGGLIGDAREAMLLAAPGSCVAMESSVAGLPSDALKAVTDVGAIERLDASSLSAYVGGQVARGSTGVAVVNQDRLPDEEVFDLSILEALAAQGSSAGGDWEDEDVDGSVHSSNVWAAQPRARRAGRGGGGYAPSSVADTVDPDPTTAAFDAIAAAGRVEGGGGPAPLLDMAHTPKAIANPLVDLSDGVPTATGEGAPLPSTSAAAAQPPRAAAAGQDLLGAGTTPTASNAAQEAAQSQFQEQKSPGDAFFDSDEERGGPGGGDSAAAGSEPGSTAGQPRKKFDIHIRDRPEGAQADVEAVQAAVGGLKLDATPSPTPSRASSMASMASTSTPGIGGPAMRPAMRPAPQPTGMRPPLATVVNDPFAVSALLPPQQVGASGQMPGVGAGMRPMRAVAAAAPIRVPSPGAPPPRAAPLPALFGEPMEDAPLQPLSSGLALPDMQRPTAANPLPVDRVPAFAAGRSTQQQQQLAAAAARAAVLPGATAAQPAQPAAGPPSGDFHQQGVAAMEAGQWDAAVAAFTSALHAAAAQRRPTGQGAQYLAAVRLVKESTVAGNKLQRARLTRYAAALNGLEERHRLALAQSAATRNMEVGNFRYAGEQLTWLIEKSSGVAPESYLRKLQQNILECDRRGPLNANLPSDETTASLRLLTTAASPSEVEAILRPIFKQ